MPADHDASYKLLFSSPELVRDLVLGFIPDEWLHSLDYGTLEKMPASYVTDDLRHRADDVSGSGRCCCGKANTIWHCPKCKT